MNAPTHEVARLERVNARWRTAAVGALAGLVGLLAGGLTQPDTPEYDYVATEQTIYRIDGEGRIQYLRVFGGSRTSDGYLNWGDIRVDESRPLEPRP